MIFQEKYLSRYIPLADEISLFGRLYFMRCWIGCLNFLRNWGFAIIYCPVCDVINFEINLSFLIERFFYITKKSYNVT